jgi:hypothetical protein
MKHFNIEPTNLSPNLSSIPPTNLSPNLSSIPPPNPFLVIGALLALGVVRLIDLGKAVDKCAEPRVSTDDDSTEETPDE